VLAVDRKNFQILVTDLQAAGFCIDMIDEPDDRVLGRKFLSIHQAFLRNVDRSRPGLFADVDREMLVDIVRRWMRLYLHTLDDVRRRFPRGEDAPDLVIAGTNWSERLDASFAAIDRIDIPSRYAEFWAERSITDPVVRASYDERFAMVGSACYVELDTLNRAGDLLIVDGFTNAIPVFDLARLRGDIDEECRARGWRILRLADTARSALARSCGYGAGGYGAGGFGTSTVTDALAEPTSTGAQVTGVCAGSPGGPASAAAHTV
jgi:hypothetical protein